MQLPVLVSIVLLASGCASTKGYFTDRSRDAADIFTATVGIGAGLKARVGPLQTGLFANRDVAGLRGGTVGFPFVQEVKGDIIDTDFFLFPLFTFGFEGFDSDNMAVFDRQKDVGSIKLLPFLSLVSNVGDVLEKEWDFSRQYFHYYTALELAVGLGGTLRFGFNPGELLDFILGWTTIDIFNDDLDRRKAHEEESIGMGTPLSGSPPHTTDRTDRVISGSAAIDRRSPAE